MRHQTCQIVLITALLASGFNIIGCLNRELAPAEPSTQSGVLTTINQTGSTKLDILFLVDNSNSMEQEQEVLRNQIVIMAQELISPTNPGDPAVQDMHIGIVTSDIGTMGFTIQTCSNPMQGDNGSLQNTGMLEGCQSTYNSANCAFDECPWLVHSLEYPDDGTDASNPPIWDDFGCIASLGTGGCGFEQQLEATLIALTEQTDPGGDNEGFLRDDSLLAIIYVTDEDDCSTDNPEMFNPSSDFGSLNTRCALHEEQLHPITRYYDAFVNLRGGDVNRVVVAAITGVPIDGSWNPGDDIDALRAIRQVNPSNPNELLRSCDTDMGAAYPPVRIAELIYAFGTNGVLESICRDDWSAALEAITRKIQDKLPGVCVDRPLASTDADVCRVIETLHGDVPCPNPVVLGEEETYDTRIAGWHVDLGLDDEGNKRCEILPADYDGDRQPDEGIHGWYYFDDEEECEFGQVKFTDTDVTSDNSTVRFECLTALCPERRQCPAAAYNAPACPDGNCQNNQACVNHTSNSDVCGFGEDGRALTCNKCSLRLSDRCTFADDVPVQVTGEVLVSAGGCCAEGFHCENESCVADRTNTACQ